MIKSFRCKDTQALFAGRSLKRFRTIEDVAVRRLSALEAAKELRDLRSPPGNRFEALKGDRHGQYNIRINGPWRICFAWTEQGAVDVEIVDYH